MLWRVRTFYEDCEGVKIRLLARIEVHCRLQTYILARSIVHTLGNVLQCTILSLAFSIVRRGCMQSDASQIFPSRFARLSQLIP